MKLLNKSPEVHPNPENSFKSQWLRLLKHDRLIALLLYFGLSLIITFPLIFHLNDSAIGPYFEGDASFNAWIIWWFRHALETGQNPVYTNYLFGLLPSSQIFVLSYFNYSLAFLLQFVFSPLATYNLLIFSGFVLSGFTMYLLAREFMSSKVACFAAGCFYDFSTFHFIRAAGHMERATIYWLPFLVWRIFVFYRRPTFKNGLLAGVGLALGVATDLYFLPYFILPFVVLFVAGKLVTDWRWFLKARNLLLSGLVGLTAGILLFPVVSQYLKVDPENQAAFKIAARNSTEQLGANLAAYVLPHSFNPFFGQLTRPFYDQMEYVGEKSIFLGYVILLLAVTGFFFAPNRVRRNWFWLILGLTGLLLSLGPKVYLVGDPVMWWPFYNLVFDQPFLSNFRAPTRMGLLPLFAFSLLAAQAIEAMYRRVAGNLNGKLALSALTGFLLLFSLVEHSMTSLPYPLESVADPALFHQIAEDKTDGLVLDLPVTTDCINNYNQVIHQKRIVTGCVPRATYSMLNSVDNLPYMLPFRQFSLANTPEAKQGNIYPETLDFKAGLQMNNIRYVVFHNRVESKIEKNQLEWMESYLEEKLGKPFYNNPVEGLRAWIIEREAITTKPDYSFRLGQGWQQEVAIRNGKLERLVEQDGQLVLTSARAGTQSLNLSVTPLYKPLTLEVRFNGATVRTIKLEQPWATQNIRLENLPLKAGENILEFHAVEGCSFPYELDPKSNDVRCLSFGVQQIELVPGL